jgi:hypothetical protein
MLYNVTCNIVCDTFFACSSITFLRVLTDEYTEYGSLFTHPHTRNDFVIATNVLVNRDRNSRVHRYVFHIVITISSTILGTRGLL